MRLMCGYPAVNLSPGTVLDASIAFGLAATTSGGVLVDPTLVAESGLHSLNHQKHLAGSLWF